jgi:hypothetical protein
MLQVRASGIDEWMDGWMFFQENAEVVSGFGHNRLISNAFHPAIQRYEFYYWQHVKLLPPK